MCHAPSTSQEIHATEEDTETVDVDHCGADADAPRTPQRVVTRGRQPVKRKHEAMVQEAYDVMKTLHKRCNDRDEHQSFGDFVACKLRTLKTQHARSTVQQKILTIVHDAETGTYDTPHGQSLEQNVSDIPSPLPSHATYHMPLITDDPSSENYTGLTNL